MELSMKDYILGVWFADKKDFGNIMITVKKDEKGNWYGEIRYRYYSDDKVFDSNDKKVFSYFYPGKDETEEQIIKKINMLFDIIKVRYSDLAEFVEIRGGFDEFRYKMAQRDWCQMKTITKDDPEWEKYSKLIGKRENEKKK